MVQDSEFAYAQARVQARHGIRPTAATWERLESVADFRGYLHALRETSLDSWIRPLTPSADSHTIERLLRSQWSAYSERVAAWTPSKWRPSIRWWSVLPLLPALHYLQQGGKPPDWFRRDVALTSLDPESAALLTPPSGKGKHCLDAWALHWRRLWPRARHSQVQALLQLQAEVMRHLRSMNARSDDQEQGEILRRELAKIFTRLFRRHAQSPVAVFCHLGLTALDVERVRGGLSLRCLFPRDRGALQ